LKQFIYKKAMKRREPQNKFILWRSLKPINTLAFPCLSIINDNNYNRLEAKSSLRGFDVEEKLVYSTNKTKTGAAKV